MILEHVRGIGYDDETHDGSPEIFDGADYGRLPVAVVFTTIEGTLAALNQAAHLAVGLSAQIVILATEVVSVRYTMSGLTESANFFQRLCQAMVTESELPDVAVEVYLCRDQLQCLEGRLRPRSIVLIGVSRRWWPRRERHLERALNRRGFGALLVQSNHAQSRVHSATVVRRMLEEARQVPQ
jgi:hypothetical protein